MSSNSRNATKRPVNITVQYLFVEGNVLLRRNARQLLSIYGATLNLPAFVQVFLDGDKVDTSLHSLLSPPYFQSSFTVMESLLAGTR